MNPFHVVIPARFASTRFPGKLLMDLGGMTILQRVYRKASEANPASILIATDDAKIFDEARAFGADVMMTDPNHATGTDRISEVIAKRNYAPSDIIVNVQGDEPFIDPKLIAEVAHILMEKDVPVGTLCTPIESLEKYKNPSVVKVVRNCLNQALYFSRSPIPMHRDNPTSFAHTFRHIGLYAYSASFLKKWPTLPACPYEDAECLEQLRILWAGDLIGVEEASVIPAQDINVPEDLDFAREYLLSKTPSAIDI